MKTNLQGAVSVVLALVIVMLITLAIVPRRESRSPYSSVLKELTVAHAQAYYRVLDRNRSHLSRYGDY